MNKYASLEQVQNTRNQVFYIFPCLAKGFTFKLSFQVNIVCVTSRFYTVVNNVFAIC